MQQFERLGVCSIILTSGTLSPLDSFALELNLYVICQYLCLGKILFAISNVYLFLASTSENFQSGWRIPML